MGENNPMCGKGYLISSERNGMFGKTHTEEWCKNHSLAMTGENHPNYGKDKWAEEKAKGAPLCACLENCGERTTWNPKTKQHNEYIHGHFSRGENHPFYGKKLPDQSVRMKENNPMYIPEVAKKVAKKTSKRMSNGGAAHAQSFITNPSKPQVELFELVKLLYPNAILNYPSLNCSIDIAIPEHMVAIEYDGSYWHQIQEVDETRQAKLEIIGWKFLRYCDYIPSIEELGKDLCIIHNN